MEIKEFITGTIIDLKEDTFNELKNRLVGEYISFDFVEESDINSLSLAEKLSDYFRILRYKTKDELEEVLHKYISFWEMILNPKIEKGPQNKKNEPSKPTCRARKYYDKMIEVKGSRCLTMRQIIDFTRIAMGLYSEAIEEKDRIISDFNFSIKKIDIDHIISELKEEKNVGINPFNKKNLILDTKDLYCHDTCILMITMIIFYTIINTAVLEGEL